MNGHVQSVAESRYRPEIDGLRFVAVVPVVLFHAGVTGFSGGFVGVDVFFVISGFLITGILHREALRGEFSIRNFYERRIRRIFPALFFLMAVTVVTAQFILLPDEMVALGRQVAAASFSVSNILFWREAGYFDAEALTKPLLHTWSLAVEEQFYIVFPLVLWLIVRFRATWLPSLILVGGAVSLALSIWSLEEYPSATFYLLPTRAWELLLGGFFAVLPIYRGRFAEALSWIGLALIMLAAFRFRESMAFPGLAALVPCLGTALLLWASQGTRCGKMLSFTPLRWIGLISYSLYLWHWPIIVFAEFKFGADLPVWTIFAIVASSVGMAALSWRFVERPFRYGASPRAVWTFGAACLASGIAVPAVLIANDGFPKRFASAELRDVDQAIAQQRQARRDYDCTSEQLRPDDPNFGPCPIGVAGAQPRFIVIGDSHGMAFKPAFDNAARSLKLPAQMISVPGCAPLLGLDRIGYDRPCADYNEQSLRYVGQARPDFVVLVASWRNVLTEHETRFGVRLAKDDSSRLANAKDALRKTVRAYQGIGAKVVVLMPVPGVPEEYSRAKARGSQAELTYSRSEYMDMFGGLGEVARMSGADVVVDLADAFCSDRCASTNAQGEPLYRDRHHVNANGNRLLEPLLRDAIEEGMALQRQ